MAALILALAIAASQAGSVNPVERWHPLIDRASRRFGVPADWIEKVMAAESGGATTLGGLPIRSRTGAIGLMQLMPATWEDLRITYGLGTDPDDPADNITAGTAYLRELYDRFGYPALFAAYNAGPQRYRDYLAGTATLPFETRSYLTKVVGATMATPSITPVPPSIFVLRHDRESPNPWPDRAQPPSLFALPEMPR